MASVGDVPMPEPPYWYLPGSALAAAISLGIVSCAKPGWQHSRLGCVPIHTTVSKSVKAL